MEGIAHVYSKFPNQSIYYFVLLCCFVKLHKEKNSRLYLTYEVLSEYCQDRKGFYLKTPF